MHRTAHAPLTRFAPHASGGWLARRWYYTPKTHRAYSVRPIAPGDRRLLAEFTLALSRDASERDASSVRELSDMVFDRVLGGDDMTAGVVALESGDAGDCIIGICALAPGGLDHANVGVAVASTHREEQVGRTLLDTLIRHARRVGIRRLEGEMHWANRPMQRLAQSLGFTIEPVARDKNLRHLVLGLK
jgi:RimJ/RimL family protein N-acetyltransferase